MHGGSSIVRDISSIYIRLRLSSGTGGLSGVCSISEANVRRTRSQQHEEVCCYGSQMKSVTARSSTHLVIEVVLGSAVSVVTPAVVTYGTVTVLRLRQPSLLNLHMQCLADLIENVVIVVVEVLNSRTREQ